MRWVLFGVSAVGSTGYIAAVTVSTLVAAELSGGPALGGLPTATTTIGTAAAASLLALLMLRIGRRGGILLGLLVGAIGGATVFASVLIESIPLLLLGSAMTGFANAAGNLGRYIAADMATPERRASAIGLVVWGTTIGTVLGPNLAGPAGSLAAAIGLPELAGAYGVTVIFVGAAVVAGHFLLRPEPYALADPSALQRHDEPTGPAPSLASLLVRPVVLAALVSLVAAQVVMVLIMTMTPLHLTDHGHGLATVGLVLSAHTFGMFGLSPITGRLTDRFGSVPVIGAGLATLAGAALLAALAPPDGGLGAHARPVPPRLRLEPVLRGRLVDPQPRPRPVGADSGAGHRRHADLGHCCVRQPCVGADRRHGVLHRARLSRHRADRHPRACSCPCRVARRPVARGLIVQRATSHDAFGMLGADAALSLALALLALVTAACGSLPLLRPGQTARPYPHPGAHLRRGADRVRCASSSIPTATRSRASTSSSCSTAVADGRNHAERTFFDLGASHRRRHATLDGY